MAEPKKVAENILAYLHDEYEKRGHLHIPLATLYKAFEKEASYEIVQQALGLLVDRDLIAPYSYSLTAKGRREHTLRAKSVRGQSRNN
jgi:hypothetical protein